MFKAPMDTLTVNAAGHLTIGGADCVELAREYGTPAYVLDETVIRSACRMYKETMAAEFGEGSMPFYAGKALSCKYIYRLAAEEGIGIDVVSSGEIATAEAAGFPLSRAIFHGNNKTDSDIRFALTRGTGCFAVDNAEELDALDAHAGALGLNQKIQLRITPGIDPHTHKAVSTGNIDSKFGAAIATGQALALVRSALAKKNLTLAGLHCHIGSQIFDTQPFRDAAEIMLRFIYDIKKLTGYEIRELNLGGGYGVRYVNEDPVIDYRENIRAIAAEIKELCEKYELIIPKIFMEPGRSIVAPAGITLYTVGPVKEIPGFKNYVSVDGGMPDNPRYALYGSLYEAYIANRAADERDYLCTVAGRCCESGDVIAERTRLQKPRRGDILAVAVTGAYNYSMASNYNRIARPPIISVREGISSTVVRREALEDMYRLDV